MGIISEVGTGVYVEYFPYPELIESLETYFGRSYSSDVSRISLVFPKKLTLILKSQRTLLKKGDRVVLPFNVADGRCLNCEEGNTAFCTGVNPGFAGAAYGYVAMGPYAGGQV